MAGPFYWVLGSGNSNDAAGHWSTSDGGLPDAANVPDATSDVHFTALSNTTAYTFTVNAAFACKDLMFDAAPAVSGTITWAGSSAMTISGSMLLLSGMTVSYGGASTFNSTTTGKTIDSNGVTTFASFIFNGVGGGWTLLDDLNLSGTLGYFLTLTNGALVSGGYAITANRFVSVGAGTRSFDASGSTLSFGASAAGRWDVTSGLSLTVDTSTTITMGGDIWNGAGLTYNDVTLSGPPTTNTGADTYRNLTISGGSTFPALDSNKTITATLTLTGTSAVGTSKLYIRSSVVGTPRTITAAAVSLTDVDFSDTAWVNSTAPGTHFTGTRLGNAAGNSGDIDFTTAAPKYWHGHSANWDAANVWATSSGSAGATNNFPLPQDTAIFDDAGIDNSQTVTVNGAFRLPSIDFSALTRTGVTFATGSQAPTAYGDLKLTTAGTFAVTGTGAITLSGRNTQTITSNGVAWTQPFTLNSIGGTMKLADAATLPNTITFTHTTGVVDVDGQDLSTGIFNTSGALAREIKSTAAGGKIVTTNTTATTVFTAATVTNLTVTRNSWTIEIGGNTTNIRICNLGSAKTWPAITFTNTTANGELDLVSSGTTTVIKSLAVSTPPQTIKRTAATTIAIEDATTGFPSGTAGNLLYIGSITNATHTWAKSGAGTVTPDYLDIHYSTAPADWDAGLNSVNGGNNSGWIFTISAALTGVVGTGAVGTLADGFSLALSGEYATSTAGDLLANLTLTLTGVFATGAPGFLWLSRLFRDRVKETSTTTGTGIYTLLGAQVSYQAFSVIGELHVCDYCCTDGTDWEVGLGGYSGDTLARIGIYASSNNGNAVDWSAGTKTIFLDLAAATVQALVDA